MKIPGFILLSFLVTVPAAAETLLPVKVLRPFIEKNCVRCHGPKKQKGKLRLDTLALAIPDNPTAQRWQDVLDALNAGDMPPEKEPQPDAAELTAVLGALTDGLKVARRRLSDQGREITVRRLNRREYLNTIHALFGFTLLPGLLPADDPVDSFDTVGSQQFFSSYHFEQYLELGRKIVRAGFQWGNEGRRKLVVNSTEPEKGANRHLRKGLQKRMERWREVVNGLENGKTWKELGFKDGRELHFYLNFHADRAGRPQRYLAQEFVDTGIYLGRTPPNPTINQLGDPRATYKVRILAGLDKQPKAFRHFLKIEVFDETVGYLKVRGTAHQPEMLEYGFTPRLGNGHGGKSDIYQLRLREKRNEMVDWTTYLRLRDPYGNPASIWVDRLEVEGPFYGELTFFEKLFFPTGEKVKGKKKLPRSDEDALVAIRSFAFESTRRRPPGAEFLDGLYGLYRKGRAAGLDVEDALVDPLAVVLASPGFLYLGEEGGGGDKELSARELAIRLSYFLWSAPPDDALYASAADGSLLRPGVLEKQVDRLLADPRAWSFIEGFMSQWMDLKRFDNIVVNPKEYTAFDEGVRLSARKEPLHLFGTLLRENLPLSELIDSDFVVIDSILGQYYGIRGVEGEHFRKVKLPGGSRRGGLLGTAAFLTMTSTGDRTSPIIRGAVIMEKLLNDKPASPPPNVPELDEASATPVSVREAILLHQEKPQCASCHGKFDAIGFGLENFDAVGLWREKEKVGGEEVAVRTSGLLPGALEYRDLDDLKARLMEQKERLAASLAEGVMGYGLGRSIEFSDGEELLALVKALREDDYRARTLVHALVRGRLFRRK